MHNRDKQCIGRQCTNKFAHVQFAVPIYTKVRYFISIALELFADFENGRMLYGSCDDVAPVRISSRGAQNGGVIAFRSTAGE